MTSTAVAEGLSAVRRSLQAIGFTNGLLEADYQFADYSGPGALGKVRTIHLAGFGQAPLTTKTACIGVVLGNRSSEELIRYRSLGAPQLLTLSEHSVSRWMVRAEGPPTWLESFPIDRVSDVITSRKDQWGPQAILRAKAVSFNQPPIQLDFFDKELIPTLERVIRRKLNELLNQVVTSTIDDYKNRNNIEPDMEQLFRLIFRLIAAKLLADRQETSQPWLVGTAADVVERVEQFYLPSDGPQIPPALSDPATRVFAWGKILDGFHLQNVSLDTLAWIWENCFVTPAIRERLGIHGPPPAVAEYVVRRLPFESILSANMHVFEPCTGQATFLVAALGRIRELILAEQPDLDSTARHERFVKMLSGLELESFATEIARLSLMLADYPHPAGWTIHLGDVFEDNVLARLVRKSTVVLCNPPFGRFEDDEGRPRAEDALYDRSAEIIRRVLINPPKLLGFVLPRQFRDGRVFRDTRRAIAESYASVEVTELPDNVFTMSNAESVLVIAYGDPVELISLQAKTVERAGVEGFLRTGEASSIREATLTPSQAEEALWVYELDPVWSALRDHSRLSSIAVSRIGIQEATNRSDQQARLVSEKPSPGARPGVQRVTSEFESYFAGRLWYFDLDASLIRRKAHRHPWQLPKVLVNRNRRTRRAWTLTAVPDFSGLVASLNFHAFWPTTDVPVEVISAVLNGFVANAWVDTQEEKRHSGQAAILSVPIPIMSQLDTRRIVDLVSLYQGERAELQIRPSRGRAARCLELLREVDSLVLAAYQLPSDLEQLLLDHFSGQVRPGTKTLRRIAHQDDNRNFPLFAVDEQLTSDIQADDADSAALAAADAALELDISRMDARLRIDYPELFDASGRLRVDEARRILRERTEQRAAAARAALHALRRRSGGRAPDAT